MARLIYSSVTSLDGFIEDANGSFDWSIPSEEQHGFINDMLRGVGTHLYGRRLYETMSVWETLPLDDEPPVMADFATIWHSADKVVYSRTLDPASISTTRTRLATRFDPVDVAALKADSARDQLIGGAELGAHALRAGLVDEVHQYLTPVIVGGGKRFLPEGLDARLELLDEHRFGNGVVFVRYRMIG